MDEHLPPILRDAPHVIVDFNAGRAWIPNNRLEEFICIKCGAQAILDLDGNTDWEQAPPPPGQPAGVEPATSHQQGGGYAPGSPSVDPAPPEPSAPASVPLPISGSHDERRFASTAPPAAPSSERSLAPERETQPGHPFNKAMDNGWGDIRYLEPIGPSTPSAPAEKAVTVRPSPIFQDTPPGRDTVS